MAAVEVEGRKDLQIMGLATGSRPRLGAHLLKIISRDDGPSSITLRNEKPVLRVCTRGAHAPGL